MSVRWERFAGSTSSFAIRMSFQDDPDSGEGMEPDVAASWGSVQIWVDGVNLCSHMDQGEQLQACHWYMLPLLEWFVEQWDPLLHEERLPTLATRAATAADVDVLAPALSILESVRPDALALDGDRFDWQQRHALRSARDGGILPGLSFRRYRGLVEVSWQGQAIAGAPDISFTAPSGYSLQEPDAVAKALYAVVKESVAWLNEVRPGSERLTTLAEAVDLLPAIDRAEERTAWLAGLGKSRSQVLRGWRSIVAAARATTTDMKAFESAFKGEPNNLYTAGSCQAALLFGSASPTLSESDALELARLLLDGYDPAASDTLADLVADELPDLTVPAWVYGYELADIAAEAVNQESPLDAVDIETFLNSRSVNIRTVSLSDKEIRAISLVGRQHKPTIALNTSSRFFSSRAAQRFSLAHELCHLLFDRDRAVDLAVASGPWAPLYIEQRANAFAAMLLMPVDRVSNLLVASATGPIDAASIRSAAAALDVSAASLVDHAHNLDLIDESSRDELRSTIWPTLSNP